MKGKFQKIHDESGRAMFSFEFGLDDLFFGLRGEAPPIPSSSIDQTLRPVFEELSPVTLNRSPSTTKTHSRFMDSYLALNQL